MAKLYPNLPKKVYAVVMSHDEGYANSNRRVTNFIGARPSLRSARILATNMRKYFKVRGRFQGVRVIVVQYEACHVSSPKFGKTKPTMKGARRGSPVL